MTEEKTFIQAYFKDRKGFSYFEMIKFPPQDHFIFQVGPTLSMSSKSCEEKDLSSPKFSQCRFILTDIIGNIAYYKEE